MDFMYRSDGPSSQGNVTATALMATGQNYKDLVLKVAGGTVAASNFTQLQVLINGKPTIDLVGADLDAINAYDSLQAFGGTDFRIPLGLLGMNDPLMRDTTNINTGIASPKTGKIAKSLQLKYTLSGATSPVLAVFGQVSEQDPSGPGIVKKYLTHQWSISSVDTPFTLPQVYGNAEHAYIRRVFFKLSSGTMTRMRIMAGGVPVWDSDTDVAQRLQQDSLVRTPGSYFALVAEFPPDIASGRMGSNNKADDLPWLNLTKYDLSQKGIQFVGAASGSVTATALVEVLGEIPG